MLILFIISLALSVVMLFKMFEYYNRPTPVSMIVASSACYLTTGILFNLTFLQ